MRQKVSKTQIVPSKDIHEYANKRSNQLEGTEVDRPILEDQAQIEEENQVGDRPRAAAAPSQLTLISGISEAVRTVIARKKEDSKEKRQRKRLKRKKTRKKVSR